MLLPKQSLIRVKLRKGRFSGTERAEKNSPALDAKTVEADEDFVALQCQEYSFRQDAVMATDKLAVSTSGNTVTVVNQSGQMLRNVCLYYKSVHEDGHYFGGITYMLSFGDLAPGETAQKQSSHYGAQSKIVRYSFQES